MKLKKLRLIFIIAIINVSCGNENINDLKEKADRLCIDQEYLEAISLYNVVLQIDPRCRTIAPGCRTIASCV
jgi:hypothetical protein